MTKILGRRPMKNHTNGMYYMVEICRDFYYDLNLGPWATVEDCINSYLLNIIDVSSGLSSFKAIESRANQKIYQVEQIPGKLLTEQASYIWTVLDQRSFLVRSTADTEYLMDILKADTSWLIF